MTLEAKAPKRKSAVQTILTAGTILLSLGILTALIYPQRDMLISYNWNIHWRMVVLTFVVFSINLLVVALIWAWIMNSFWGGLSLLEHLRVYLVSHLARRLPGTVWYVASRVVLYRQKGIRARFTMVASGLELLVMMVSGILISLVFSLSIMTSYGVGHGWFVAFALLGGGLLHPKSLRLILQKANVELPATFRFWQVGQWVVAYTLAWVLGGMVLFGVTNIVVDVPISNLPYLIGCWSIVGVVSTTLFFLPSNLGFTEVGLSLLLSVMVPSPIAVVIALLVRLLLIVFEIFWAAVIFGVNRNIAVLPSNSMD